jgi:uncharacterized glyoxalase superfamily protein PhnB
MVDAGDRLRRANHPGIALPRGGGSHRLAVHRLRLCAEDGGAGEGGKIAHAELNLGNGMVMLGDVETEYGRLVAAPEKGRPVTQGIYVVVDDADAHYARAKAAGAEIVIDIKTQDYGGRDYTARDPEGHVWTFGSYDPWVS